ncbi:MAG TPA: hypothetical protein VK958_10455 [Methylophilus sp.]|uniref:hypothetical protein n=1 Tax=Methylophilus sp. TaxID=29541 RepID=UPI002CE10727|nr:hypothetical protein [Methylophilus sp.]HSH87654.1 hypothetical protein [Methylophilus sp.]
MLTSIEFANEVFEELSLSIDQACKERYWFIACRNARVLGFSQTDISSGSAYGQCFELQIEPDIHLSLTYISIDCPDSLTPSDVTRFELRLKHGDALIKSYQNEFEEAPLSIARPVRHRGYSATL